MPTPPPAVANEQANYRYAGILALVGAALLAAYAGWVGTGQGTLRAVLSVATACLGACVVMLAMTIRAVRGRNLGIALGMISTVTGVAGAITVAVTGKPGPLATASTALAFAGALIVGLSFPKPRPGYPRYAVFAALSGAALLALIGAIGILTADKYAALAYLVPAIAWAWLGRTLLGPVPLPPQPKPAPRIRPAGQTTQPSRKRKPRKRR